MAEYSVQRNYLDLFLDLPWGEFSEDQFDLKRVQKILDRDHYGLEEEKAYYRIPRLEAGMIRKSPIFMSLWSSVGWKKLL